MTVIGGDDERDGYAIARLTAATLLRDRVVVTDGRAGEVRFYDVSGTLVHRQGRLGSGPGEYRALRAAGTVGDTAVAVWDAQLQRATIVSERGSRVVVPQWDGLKGTFPRFLGIMREGPLVFRDEPSLMAMREERTGERRDSIAYHFIGQDGTPIGTLRVAGDQVWFVNEEEQWTRQGLIFGKTVVEAITDHGFLLGESDNLSFLTTDVRGSVTARFSLPFESRPVAKERVDAERQRLIDEARTARSALAQITVDGKPFDPSAFAVSVLERTPSANTYPAFSKLFGAGAQFWYCLDDVEVRTCIEVENGAQAASVAIPSDWGIQAFRDRRVLVSQEDELGRTKVLLYGLQPQN